MSTFGAKLVARLTAHAPLAAIVQSRVRPFAGAQGERLPYVTYQVIDQDFESFNALTRWSGTRKARVQIDCVSRSKAEAEDLAEAVIDALNGWTDTTGTIQVHGAVPVGARDLDEFEGGAGESVIYRRSVDFSVHTHRDAG